MLIGTAVYVFLVLCVPGWWIVMENDLNQCHRGFFGSWIPRERFFLSGVRRPVSSRDKTSIENFVKTSKQFLRNLANLRNIVFQPNLYNVVSIVLWSLAILLHIDLAAWQSCWWAVSSLSVILNIQSALIYSGNMRQERYHTLAMLWSVHLDVGVQCIAGPRILSRKTMWQQLWQECLKTGKKTL